MQHLCEICRRQTDLYYVRFADEYWCEQCLDNKEELNDDQPHVTPLPEA